jgi:RNA polymerase sigma factor (TIGR02999 family)
MASQDPERITQLLGAWRQGNRDALDRLIPLVHDELRRLARSHMNRERAGHTLQPTALVNEAYLRLHEMKQIQWQDREHFFAVSARVMRRILVDSARARRAHKRGDGVRFESLENAAGIVSPSDAGMLDLDEALNRLESLDERKARIVEMRFFSGLSVEETAVALDVSPRTVKRDWTFAKAWLSAELSELPDGR